MNKANGLAMRSTAFYVQHFLLAVIFSSSYHVYIQLDTRITHRCCCGVVLFLYLLLL